MLLICAVAVAQGAKVYHVNQPEGVPGTGQGGGVAGNPDGTGLATHYTAAGPAEALPHDLDVRTEVSTNLTEWHGMGASRA